MSAPRKGIALESLTWPEAEALFRRAPAPVVVRPVGARTKEHGLHLPLNNDWILAEYFLARVLDALPVVALPGIPYGYYPLAPMSPRLRRCHGIWVDVARAGHTGSL
jgi:creatinine amidohydrolase/Fe(II)-dependent formamide hydrolase-like protein